MAVYKRWKFTLLLLATLVLILVHPLIDVAPHAAALLFDLIRATIALCAILILFERRQSRIVAWTLGSPTVVVSFTNYVFPGAPPLLASVLYNLLPVIFLGYTFVVILTTIFLEKNVSADHISGAFCGYLVIGVTFGHLFSLVETLRPNSFFLAENLGPLPAGEGVRSATFIYYSLVTLTTVGYGDITPRSHLARTLSVLEAILGQFYVAVIVAALVALNVTLATEKRSQDRPPTSDQ
jgi:hypothetical protein